MHQIRFRLGLCPRPRWDAHSAPRPPSWIWGPLRGRGKGKAGEEEGKGRGNGGREREGPQVTVELGPLRALLCHWLPSPIFYHCGREAAVKILWHQLPWWFAVRVLQDQVICHTVLYLAHVAVGFAGANFTWAVTITQFAELQTVALTIFCSQA